jgi:Rhodanese-like domain
MIKKLITYVLVSIFMLISVGCVQTAKNTTSAQLAPLQVAGHKTPEKIVKEAKASINEVSVEQLKKMLDNKEDIIVLDVRDRDEFEKEYISGAIHMSRGLVDLHLYEIVPNKSAKIVAY